MRIEKQWLRAGGKRARKSDWEAPGACSYKPFGNLGRQSYSALGFERVADLLQNLTSCGIIRFNVCRAVNATHKVLDPMDVQSRVAHAEDAEPISALILAALQVSNAQDYPPEVIAKVRQNFTAAHILALLSQRQVYVATLKGRVVGTASLDGQVVRSVFVEPGLQGSGIGRKLMSILEAVAAHEGVKTLKVPSSITAEGFYRALGYSVERDEYCGDERTIIMVKQL